MISITLDWLKGARAYKVAMFFAPKHVRPARARVSLYEFSLGRTSARAPFGTASSRAARSLRKPRDCFRCGAEQRLVKRRRL